MEKLKKYILVDIDNTIISQNKRKQKIIKELFGSYISLAEINADYSLVNVIKKVAVEKGFDQKETLAKFNEAFFGAEFYEAENLEVVKNANYYLTKLSEFVDIIYLTSRAERLRKVTQKSLNEFGFPKGELIMAREENKEAVETYDEVQLKEKNSIIKDLVLTREIVFGVGDTAADSISYYENGVQAVLITTHESEKSVEKEIISRQKSIEDYDEFGFIALDSWEEIYDFALYSLGESDDLQEIIDIQTKDYTNFLGDLDNKSSMILIIATFCATAFFSAITARFYGDNLFLKISSILGLAFSLLSVFFAIKSFSSKVAHGKDRMGKIIFDAFFKKKTTLAPHLEKKVVNKSKFARTATIKYLHSRYDTLDKKAIKNKTLYNMRSANYEKIFPEFQAKICLFFAIGFMFLSALIFVIF